MLHPHTELRLINQVVGFGIVATQFIPKGTITWVLHRFDQIFTPGEFKAMPLLDREIVYKYAYRNQEGNYILCWDHARYINHSFHSNCVSTAYEFELAVRDIYPGEELTDDYGYLNIEEPFDCLPEEGTERRQVMPDDLLYYHEEWDRQLLSAFTQFEQVEQPLAQFLTSEQFAKAQAISRNETKMDSILTCFYPTTPEEHTALLRVLSQKPENDGSVNI